MMFVLPALLSVSYSIACLSYFLAGKPTQSVVWGIMALIFGALALFERYEQIQKQRKGAQNVSK